MANELDELLWVMKQVVIPRLVFQFVLFFGEILWLRLVYLLKDLNEFDQNCWKFKFQGILMQSQWLGFMFSRIWSILIKIVQNMDCKIFWWKTYGCASCFQKFKKFWFKFIKIQNCMDFNETPMAELYVSMIWCILIRIVENLDFKTF